MLFRGLNIYRVYIKPEEKRAIESPVLIREGFSIGAFLFHVVWALYYRTWRLMGVYVGMMFVIACMKVFWGLGIVESTIMEIGLMLWVGHFARDLYARSLEKRGYMLSDIVAASSEMEAELRFFEKLSTTPRHAAHASAIMAV